MSRPDGSRICTLLEGYSFDVKASDTVFIHETQIPVLIERQDNVLFYLRLDAKESKKLDEIILDFSKSTLQHSSFPSTLTARKSESTLVCKEASFLGEDASSAFVWRVCWFAQSTEWGRGSLYFSRYKNEYRHYCCIERHTRPTRFLYW